MKPTEARHARYQALIMETMLAFPEQPPAIGLSELIDNVRYQLRTDPEVRDKDLVLAVLTLIDYGKLKMTADRRLTTRT